MAEVNVSQVVAEFHPNAIINPSEDLFTFTLNGQPLPDKQIPVPSGIGMIVFHLTTAITPESLDEAYFQTSPIQWFETDSEGRRRDRPIATPGMFWVERAADKVVRLIDFNSNNSPLASEQIHWFNIVVAYKGKTYGADPTIINQPPDGDTQ